MSPTEALAPPQAPPVKRKPLFSLDNRYIAPAFITCILLAGHLSFGILESYQKTLLAIATSIAFKWCWDRFTFTNGFIPRAPIFPASA